MINSTFDVANNSDFVKSKLNVDYQSATGTCPAGQTTSIDYTLTDDMLLYGLQLLAKGTAFGDTASLQVVSITGTLLNGMPVGPENTVLNQFATNIVLAEDAQTKIDVTASFPAKLLGGMTIRCIYTSIGAAPVSVAMNYKLIKILS